MSLLSKGPLWKSYLSLSGVKASPNADGRARAMGHSAGPVSAMETTAGVSCPSGTVAKGDLAPQPQQEAQDRSLDKVRCISFSKNSDQPDGCCAAG